MREFLKARQTLAIVATAVGFGLAVALVGEQPLAVPLIELAGLGELFAKLVLPLIPATAIVWSLASSRSTEEQTASRPLHWYTVAHLGASTALFCLVALAAQAMTTAGDPWAVVRNTIGYIGLAVILASLLHPVPAAAANVLIALFSLTFGRLPNGMLTPAAWPILPGHNGTSWIIAIAMALTGAALFISRNRPA